MPGVTMSPSRTAIITPGDNILNDFVIVVYSCRALNIHHMFAVCTEATKTYTSEYFSEERSITCNNSDRSWHQGRHHYPRALPSNYTILA